MMLSVILDQQECKRVTKRHCCIPTKMMKNIYFIKLTICNDSDNEVWPELPCRCTVKAIATLEVFWSATTRFVSFLWPAILLQVLYCADMSDYIGTHTGRAKSWSPVNQQEGWQSIHTMRTTQWGKMRLLLHSGTWMHFKRATLVKDDRTGAG